MKLKILVALVEKLLGKNGPRADMYMPERLLAMALVFLVGGVGCAVYTVFRFEVWSVVGAVVGLGFGIFALLTWKNQSIRILSDEQFVYTTMFGRKKTYYFRDIQGLRRNQDSMTLFVNGEKVHIESMAVLSDRLADLINKQLQP